LEEIGDGKSQMGMHDLWREFALKETERGEFQKRRWVYEIVGGEALDSILSDGGWKKLQRICLMGESDNGNIQPSVKCLSFSNCKNVTVLRLVDVVVEDDAVLDLSPLIQLKILEILALNCVPVRVRGFGKLKNLKILVWVNIEAESFGCFEEISHLRNLRVLHLVTIAWGLSTTLDLSELRWLEYLRLEFQDEVTISGLGSKMANLRIIDLCSSRRLQSCLGVGDVANLEVLSLRGCEDLELLPDLQKLSKLRILDASFCKSLKTIVGLGNLIALEELCAEHCEELNGVPDLSRLTNLRRLDLWYCEQVHHIPGLSNLVALQELHASSEFLDTWPEHQKLTNLQSVTIGLWDGDQLRDDEDHELDLQEFQRDLDLAVLESISSLNVWGVHRELSNLKRLSSLQELVIHECTFKALHGLDDLSALKTLELTYSSLESLPDLGQLTSLESLVISNCKLTRLTSSGPLPALKTLHISASKDLVVWPNVSLLPGLRDLRLDWCGVKLNVWEVEVLKARCHNLYVLESSLDFDSATIDLSRREREVHVNAKEARPDGQCQECLDDGPSFSDFSLALQDDFLPYNESSEEFGVLSRKRKLGSD